MVPQVHQRACGQPALPKLYRRPMLVGRQRSGHRQPRPRPLPTSDRRGRTRGRRRTTLPRPSSRAVLVPRRGLPDRSGRAQLRPGGARRTCGPVPPSGRRQSIRPVHEKEGSLVRNVEPQADAALRGRADDDGPSSRDRQGVVLLGDVREVDSDRPGVSHDPVMVIGPSSPSAQCALARSAERPTPSPSSGPESGSRRQEARPVAHGVHLSDRSDVCRPRTSAGD